MLSRKAISLSSKADQLSQYVENSMIDKDGIIYASLESTTHKPWGPESWGVENDYVSVNGFAPWEILNYDDSGIATGSYLAALAFEWRVTGSPSSHKNACRTLAGIRHIYEIGSLKEEGYFPKIFGGRLSRDISSNQYLYIIKGMMAWLPVAPRDDQESIREMVTRMVDFWIKRKYRHDYFNIPDMPWPLRRFPALLHAAYTASGEERFLKEAKRLEQMKISPLESSETTLSLRSELRHSFSDTERALGGCYHGFGVADCAAMDITQIDECLLGSEAPRDQLLRSLSLAWRDAILSLSENGLSNGHTLYNPITQSSHTPQPQWLNDGPDPIGWSFLRWSGGFLTGRSTLVARAGIHVSKWLPEMNAAETVKKILHNIDISQMRYCIDPDGQQLHPRHRYLTRWVDGATITNWLWAYWQGRYEHVIDMINQRPHALNGRMLASPVTTKFHEPSIL